MIPKPQIKFRGLALAASLLGMPLATAAPITWSAALTSPMGGGGLQSTLPAGIFNTTGTQILAENLGGPTATTLTFDGINFTSSTRVFTTGGYDTGLADSGQNLITKGIYATSGNAGTVNLTGLTVGRQYRIQALVYDGRGATTGRVLRMDSTDLGQYANGVVNVSWGPGLLATGTFTADAITQDFVVTVFDAGYTTHRGATLNALVVHEFIPGTPGLSTPVVSNISSTDADVETSLSVVDANVTLHWATTDQDLGPWDNSNSLGAQVIGPVSGAITGLTGDTQYFYRFHAVNTGADPDTESWSTAGTSFATALDGKAPDAPSATAFSKTEIDVEWVDNFNTETGFIIERSPDGIGSWTQAGTAPADAQYFGDTNRLPGTTYFYRVSAQNAAGLSDPSTVVSATTDAPDPGIAVQAWFRMGDAGQGTNNLPLDASGNARDFTVFNGATDTTITPTGGGYSNDAYYTFNGVDQSYNTIGYDAPENNVGVEVWVRTSDLAQINAHVFGTGTNANGLNISYEAAGNRGWGGAIANVAWVGDGVGTANYTANTWIHLALVRDNGTTTFYVNGVASGTSTGTPLNATTPRMAATFDNGIFFDGSVAEARIFTFDPGQFNTTLLLYPGTGPTDPYGTWAGGFLDLTDPSSDLDFDNGGLATGIEWVTGGDPTDGSDDAGVAPDFDNTSNATHFLFTFRRRDAAASDPNTSIVVEYGSNLATWRNTTDHGVADGVTIDDSTDLGGGFHQVAVSIPRTLAAAGKLFARLRVVRP